VPAKTPPDSERVIPPSPGGFGGRATKKAGQLTLPRSRSRFLLTLLDYDQRAGGGLALDGEGIQVYGDA
jgi:hypothetical protein